MLTTLKLNYLVSCFADQKIRHHATHKGLKTIVFKFSSKVLQNPVGEAILHVHIQDTTDALNGTLIGPEETYNIDIEVSRFYKTGQIKNTLLYYDGVVKMTKEELRKGKWVDINVTNMVAEYFKLPRSDLTVIVRAQDSRNRLALVVPHARADSTNGLMPYIGVYLEDGAKRRTRRTIGMDCTEKSKETRCCRYPLKVDFEVFGWDWVIVPKQYEANYCSGDCPYAYVQKYPHTHIMHLANPPNSVGPCCGPRKMNSISMLYFDNDFNIIYSTLPGMVVESCGCS